MRFGGLVAGIAVLLIAACGNFATEAPSGAPTSLSPTVSSSAAPPSSPSVTESPSEAGPSASTSTGPPIIEPSAGVPQKLVLSDAFKAEGWDEGSFKPAGRSGDVNGFVSTVECSQGQDYPLEFRLGAQPGELRFTVVQELRSESAANTVEVAVEADGRVVETKNIGFKDSAAFVVDVTGVASLRILVARAEDRNRCQGPSTALIYGTELSG